MRAKPAVTALIRLLAQVRGEVRADIVRFLTEISGQQSGVDAAAWFAWWNEKEKTFDQEFIDYARSVYYNNDRRSAIKRAINEGLSAEFVEEKEHPNYQ